MKLRKLTLLLVCATIITHLSASAQESSSQTNLQLEQGVMQCASHWAGVRVAVFGDSITDKRGIGTTKVYWQYLAEMIGIIPEVYGRNGDQWSNLPGRIDAMAAMPARF